MFIYVLYTFLAIVSLFSVSGTDIVTSLSRVKSYAEAATQEEAVNELIHRTIGNRSREFHVVVTPGLMNEEKDVFKIFKSANSTIVELEGSSGVAVAWGFHHYLKYYCLCHVSWDNNQLNLPRSLPTADIKKTANDRFRYYQNVCTTSYSFVWWDWKQWERHIDWMALNGINLALAFNGQEAIWQRIYSRLNMTDSEIDEYFTGPAFFAWGRMGNIRGWGGPLSSAWHSSSLTLQKQILSRMRSLGIVPVLPAFAGYVPRAFKRLFPNVNFTHSTPWNRFTDQYCCPFLLPAEDPLFKTIGSLFLEEMIKEFGTNHIYNCDTFNEMKPTSGDLQYLRRIGESIFSSMTSVDPNAIWVMQGWLFFHEFIFWTKSRAQALLTSVPIGRMLVLDLMSELSPQYERFDSYFGQPFIWCMLHNFGGTLGMHGTARSVNENIFKARKLENSSMVGIGLTPEGIYQNYIIYDLMMEMGWRECPANLSEWFSNYSIRRYGQENIHLEQMWQLLKDSVYDYNLTTHVHGQYILTKRPSLRLQPEPPTWFNTSNVMTAWDEMLMAVDSNPVLNQQRTFRHDLVDLTRQAVQLKIDFLYTQVINAYLKKNEPLLRHITRSFLDLMSDLNSLLASNRWFLLGPWLESAKQRAFSTQEKAQFEEIARNQITLWGPNGEISDYACKQWAHLMADYYTPRWQLFFRELISSVVNKTPLNPKRLKTLLFTEVEQRFTLRKDSYPTFEIGSSVEISKNIHKKWRYTEDNFAREVALV